MATTHEATAAWSGDLRSGAGEVSTKSGVLRTAGTTWKERTEGTGAEAATSPEELLAAAHASCFVMALSAGIALAGAPATRIEASVKVTFGALPGGGNGVISSAISARASAPGLTDERLRELAEDAKVNCPISKALNPNVQLSVEARLL